RRPPRKIEDEDDDEDDFWGTIGGPQ
ncbi:MAG: hypothetical protein QOH78_1153, partial [Verrucomicrobiota bacterium]